MSLSILFRFLLSHRLASPISLATTLGVSFDFLSSWYLDVSVPMVRFFILCIQTKILTVSVGSPIQIFTDQRLLSSPRDFSQSATSFFASNRQGIHQMPFSFLILTMRMYNLFNHTYRISTFALIYFMCSFLELFYSVSALVSRFQNTRLILLKTSYVQIFSI